MSELQKNTPEINGLNIKQFTTLAKSEFDFDLAAGSYVVVVTDGEHTARKKLIVQ